MNITGKLSGSSSVYTMSEHLKFPTFCQQVAGKSPKGHLRTGGKLPVDWQLSYTMTEHLKFSQSPQGLWSRRLVSREVLEGHR